MNNKKIKVGMIIDDTNLSQSNYELIRLSKNSNIYEITFLIIQKKDLSNLSIKTKILKTIRKEGIIKLFLKIISRVISKMSFELLLKYEKTKIKKNLLFKDFYKTYNVDDIDINKLYVTPDISSSGLVYRYQQKDLDSIKNYNLDLLIRGGNGILKGDILTICKNGIISFHHANNQLNRGYPAGFWEVYEKQKSTGFIIQILKEELDGGDVIFKGSISTSNFYSLNLARLHNKSNIFMHKTIEKMFSDNGKIKIYSKSPYYNKLYTYPKLKQQLYYTLKTFSEIIFNKIKNTLGYSLNWNVAYQYTENWKDVTLWKSKKIKNPKNRFLADPFVIKKENKHYCFVEDYDLSTKIGSISVYEINKKGYKNIGYAIKESFHLSYPFLFEDNNILYMCPESHKANDIRIYECIDFPLKWKLKKILMKNISAADTNIFKKDNKWWLMTNIDTSNLNDHNSELHIFSSEELLTDNWIPHPKNPVIFDSELGRNGGLLLEEKDIYRVSQTHGYNLYGEQFSVSKILKLDNKDYKEELQFIVQASYINNILGSHTYNYNDGMVVTDFVKWERRK